MKQNYNTLEKKSLKIENMVLTGCFRKEYTTASFKNETERRKEDAGKNNLRL